MSCQARSLEDLFDKIESRAMAVYRRYLDELGGADVMSGRRPSTAGLAGWTMCAKVSGCCYKYTPRDIFPRILPEGLDRSIRTGIK